VKHEICIYDHNQVGMVVVFFDGKVIRGPVGLGSNFTRIFLNADLKLRVQGCSFLGNGSRVTMELVALLSGSPDPDFLYEIQQTSVWKQLGMIRRFMMLLSNRP
jgi:hypothetical protein